jgi:hypothetical protein
MRKPRKVDGICHLCGSHGKLSFEHVPPRAAFNDRPVRLYSFDEVMALGPGQTPKSRGRIQQRGVGGRTLCNRCNNLTGHWYGSHFVSWCYQGMELLQRTRGQPSLIYLNYVFPLSIIKQIATMFFSVNSDQFRLANPELEAFVLDRNRKYLSPRYRFFVYFNVEGRPRSMGTSGMLHISSGAMHVMTELSYPPYGYLLVFDNAPPDARLFEITHFARYDYGEFDVLELRLPVLPTHTAFPGDYRTREQIVRDAARQN